MNSTSSKSNNITCETVNETSTCVICLEPCEHKLRCNHVVHKLCIKEWEKYNYCPVCKRPINEAKKVKKFDNYDIDTSGDEAYALRLSNQNMNDTNNVNNLNEQDNLNQLLLTIALSLQQETHFYFNEEKKNNISLVECSNCRYTLDIESNIPCQSCNQHLYCSINCRDSHNCSNYHDNPDNGDFTGPCESMLHNFDENEFDNDDVNGPNNRDGSNESVEFEN